MNFPTQLTQEEKDLKEMYEKLKRRKAIELATKGSTGVAANPIVKSEAKTAKNSIHAAEVATEEVKKKIKDGMITVKKVDAKQTFKRAKNLLPKKQSTINSSLEMDPDTEGTSLEPGEIKLTIPKPLPVPQNVRGPTLYIRSYDLQQDSLSSAFEKFGSIKRVFVEDRRRSAFLTFSCVEEAEKAMKETDGTMINGITIRVSFARRQNQESFDQQKRFNRTSLSLDSDQEQQSPTKSTSEGMFSPTSSPQKPQIPKFNIRGLGGRGRGGGRGHGFGGNNRGRKDASDARSRSPLNVKKEEPTPSSQNTISDFDTPSNQRMHLPGDDDGSGRQLVTYDDDDSLFS